MTEEDFKKAIRIQVREEPDRDIRHFRASVEFTYVVSVSTLTREHNLDIEKQAIENAKEALLRHVYEDRRSEFYKSIEALYKIDPFNCVGFSQQVEYILKLAKRQ